MYRLMVVDDEYNIRDGLVNVIRWEDCGIEVVGEASNGQEALEKFKQLLPDIVITDICMDEMNGLEFAEKARQEKSDVKVVILSGYDQFEYAKKAIEIRVFSYMLKPVLPEELLETVQKLVSEIEEDRRLIQRIELLEDELKSRLISGDAAASEQDEKPGGAAAAGQGEKADDRPEASEESREHVKSVIKKAQDYILKNFSKCDISLISISEFVYLNPAYFSKLYKKETGESYVDYITRLRIKEAKRLLKESNIKIGDIGAKVGYPNNQYFCTLFKRITGLSPAEYREA